MIINFCETRSTCIFFPLFLQCKYCSFSETLDPATISSFIIPINWIYFTLQAVWLQTTLPSVSESMEYLPIVETVLSQHLKIVVEQWTNGFRSALDVVILLIGLQDFAIERIKTKAFGEKGVPVELHPLKSIGDKRPFIDQCLRYRRISKTDPIRLNL